MKKRFTKIMAALALLVFMAPSMVMWGQTRAEEIYKQTIFNSTNNSQSVSSYSNSWNNTTDGFKVNITNANNNNNNWSYIKIGSKNAAYTGTLTTDAAIDKAIVKVTMNISAITSNSVNSMKLYTSGDGSTWTEAGSFTKSTGDQTVSLLTPTTNLYYKIAVDCAKGSANGLVTITKVEYYIAGDTPSCAEPTFSPAAGAYTSAQSVTISTTTSGATIYYTTDGTDPTTSSSVYSSAITVNSSMTIKAMAVATGYDNSTIASASYIILDHAGTEADPYTIADAYTAIDANVGLSEVYVAGIISQVDSYNSTYHSITYWISADGTTTSDQLEVYSGKGLNNADFSSVDDVEVGATVVVYGTLKKFNDVYEFDKNNYLTSYTAPIHAVEAPTFSPVAGTYAEAQTVTISCETSGAEIHYTTDGTEPTNTSATYSAALTVSTTTTIKAIAFVGSDASNIATATYHINSQANPYTVAQALAFNEYPTSTIFVHGIVSTAPTQAPTSNGELTYYISDDGTTGSQLQVYKGKGLEQASFTAQDDIQVGDIVTITGSVKIYNSTYEFDSGNYLVEFERPVSTDPVINVTNNSIELAYDATEGSIAYSIDNPVEGVSLTATTDADWISNITVGNESITFTCTANEGTEDRTATFTLAYQGAENVTVIVTQGHYVIDYATLPFEWEGGASADFLALNGVTANGLGSDYGSTNAPYLIKFDGTGDYIQVKCDQQPGKVTIGVKMIGGASTSTITVQGSADGVTFTNIQDLTISGAQNSELTLETTAAFASTDRYVRLLFTKGSNVGVGPITIAVPTSDPVIVVTNNTVSLAYDETSGSINYSITNPVAGTNLTATPDDNWISNITIGEGTITFTATENEGTEDRTATITLSYTGAEDVEVTVTQGHYVAPAEPGNWVLTSLADLTADDIFVIVGNNGNTYAMSNDNGTDAAPAAVAVTVTEGTLSGEPAANIQWNLGITNDGYIFYPNGTTATWLYCTNTNNGVRVGTNESNVFTIGEDGYLKHTATSRYVGIYNSSDWRCYTTTTGNIANQTFAFYKKVESVTPETYTLPITAADFTSNPPTGYYFIASPVAENITPSADNGITSGNYDLYYWDEPSHTWKNYKQNSFNLVNGMGYLYANTANVELQFTGTPLTETSKDITLSKQNTTTAHGAWNLIGNPFTTAAYLYDANNNSRAYYTMKPDGSDVVLATLGNDVAAMNGIVVIADSHNEVVTFSTTAPSNGSKFLALNINQGRGDVIDRAIVCFNEGSEMPKFQLFESTKLYIEQNDEDFALVHGDNQGTLPINFKAAANGTYTLNIDTENVTFSTLILHDNLTGEDINLLSRATYSFDATTDDDETRFTLTYSKDGYTFVTDGDWDDASNWAGGEVPATGTSVTIAANVIIPAGYIAIAEEIELTEGNTITIMDGGQLKTTTDNLASTIEKGITGYNGGEGGYYLICHPYTNDFALTAVEGLLNLEDPTHVDLYSFNGDNVGEEWINYQAESFYLSETKGFLYANYDDVTLRFSGYAFPSLNYVDHVSFSYDESSTAPFHGWHLMGNLFTCNGYLAYVNDDNDPLEANFYVMNSEGNGFTLSESTVALTPCQGAFVHATSAGKVAFMSEEPTMKRTGILNMNVTQGRANVDMARIRFGQGQNLEKYSFRENNSRLYIPQNGNDYAVVYTDDLGEMPVNFKAEKNGSYTLSVSNDNVEFSYLHLIDNMTGADIDLQANPSYSFEAKTSDYASRFKLVFATGNANESSDFAFMSDGNLIVNGEGTLQVIDMMGRVVSTSNVNGVTTINLDAAAGVYVLQLNDKTQKIVVK